VNLFACHALANDQAGIGRAYVSRKSPGDFGDDEALPRVLGFYTLSMASVASHALAPALVKKIPRYHASRADRPARRLSAPRFALLEVGANA
jgi:hypothetical protein